MANSVDLDQTAPIGAVCSGSILFASILNLSVMLGKYLQQTTSADNIFRCIFFLALLRLRLLAAIYILPQEYLFSLTLKGLLKSHERKNILLQMLWIF